MTRWWKPRQPEGAGSDRGPAEESSLAAEGAQRPPEDEDDYLRFHNPLAYQARYEANLRRWVAEVHPEVDTVEATRRQQLSTDGNTWEVVTVSLLLAPFAAAIMARAGNSVTDLTSEVAKKVVGRMLEGRRHALEDALPQPDGVPRFFVEQVRVEGTDIVFVLPGRTDTEDLASAAVEMLDVDLSPLRPRDLNPYSLATPDTCEIRWIRGAWSVSYQLRAPHFAWGFAYWSREQRAWLLSSGEVCSEVPPAGPEAEPNQGPGES